ncbi:MAG: hypothetical protein ACRD01_03670, partial [Terriglobales bacterium]
MTDIGRFRVVRLDDLEQVHFEGDRFRFPAAIEGLRRQDLIEVHTLRRSVQGRTGQDRVLVASLTGAGKSALRRCPQFDRSQVVYSEMVKPREALHDSNLYRMYQRHASVLAGQGARVWRVALDFELKREYLQDLRRHERRGGRAGNALIEQVAAEHRLPVQHGKIQYPDLRIEYENPGGDLGRVDLELATASYHANHIAQKQQAGFVLYAASEDVGRLGAFVNEFWPRRDHGNWPHPGRVDKAALRA